MSLQRVLHSTAGMLWSARGCTRNVLMKSTTQSKCVTFLVCRRPRTMGTWIMSPEVSYSHATNPIPYQELSTPRKALYACWLLVLVSFRYTHFTLLYFPSNLLVSIRFCTFGKTGSKFTQSNGIKAPKSGPISNNWSNVNDIPFRSPGLG